MIQSNQCSSCGAPITLTATLHQPWCAFNAERAMLGANDGAGWGTVAKPTKAPDTTVPPVGTGIKHDTDKADMSLFSPIALEKIAQVMTFGKKKYAAHNWRGGFAWSRPLAASMRHILAFMGGQDKDPETGLSHLAHAACCIMFLLEFEETHKELDDRYKQPEVKS